MGLICLFSVYVYINTPEFELHKLHIVYDSI